MLMNLVVVSLIAATTTIVIAQDDPLGLFLPAQPNKIAVGGERGAAMKVSNVSECATECLNDKDCISFSLIMASTTVTCGRVHECFNASSCPSILQLVCPGGEFTSVSFASYGNPTAEADACAFSKGDCDAATSVSVVSSLCVGQSYCAIPATTAQFGGADPCTGVPKYLAVTLEGQCVDPPQDAPLLLCQRSGSSRIYAVVDFPVASNNSATYYQRLRIRNDSSIIPAVTTVLSVPRSGVTLREGPLRRAFDSNILYLKQYSVDDLLFNFRARAGLPQPPGAKCHGWDCTTDWVEGSLAGLFLMGAGNALRWTEDKGLRSMMDALVDGIAECAEPDGYLAAFPQDRLAVDEHPDYTTSWTVHGMLDAAIGGNSKALSLIRKHMNVFNNHRYVLTIMRPYSCRRRCVSRITSDMLMHFFDAFAVHYHHFYLRTAVIGRGRRHLALLRQTSTTEQTPEEDHSRGTQSILLCRSVLKNVHGILNNAVHVRCASQPSTHVCNCCIRAGHHTLNEARFISSWHSGGRRSCA